MFPLKYIVKLPLYFFNYHPSFIHKGKDFYTINYSEGGECPKKEGVVFMCDGKVNHGGLTDRTHKNEGFHFIFIGIPHLYLNVI